MHLSSLHSSTHYRIPTAQALTNGVHFYTHIQNPNKTGATQDPASFCLSTPSSLLCVFLPYASQRCYTSRNSSIILNSRPEGGERAKGMFHLSPFSLGTFLEALPRRLLLVFRWSELHLLAREIGVICTELVTLPN